MRKEVMRLFDYDPTTGLLTWRVHRHNRRYGGGHKGDVAGSPHSKGYVAVWINGELYLAHRVIWLYMTGWWPVGVIDHYNHKRADNRWVNLRSISNSENIRHG